MCFILSASCIKVSVNFVSTKNIQECIRLIDEFSVVRKGHWGQRDEKRHNALAQSSCGAMLKYIVSPLKDQDRRMILLIPLIAYSGLQHACVCRQNTSIFAGQ